MSKKQQTLFQSWSFAKQANEFNLQNDLNNLLNDDDDDLLRSALEETNKSYVLPHATFEEIPGFDMEAGKTWIYPTNKPMRKYQRDIVETCLFFNTLVTLPTGLGKTFIAAVVMYNFYRWYPKGKVIFMAPTKPLVAQQIQACYEIMGIPREITCELTGAMNPQERKKLWNEKRVFYLTPQVLTNDISRGACPASEIKCLVLDEAHKALGNYAYVQVMQELVKYCATFRVLALSATPGNDLKAIQQVITNLHISKIELRSEESPDILPYTHNRSLEKIVVPLGSDINQIKESFLEILGTFARRLMSMNVLFAKDIGSLTKFSIIQSRERFRRNPPETCPRSRFGIAEGDFAMCITLTHALELLTQHGIRAFYNFLFEKTDWDGENGRTHNRTRTELMKQPGFIKLMDQLKLKYGDDISRLHVSHPKLTKLEEIVVEHFKRCKSENVTTRVMIFSQYRDSVHEIVAILMEHSPLIKAMSFVGHGPSTGGAKGKGFTQADQLRVIKEFTEGNYNTLVSTCVGEEGLDIGDVDVIICYDMHKSPVRLVQRCGRTGRKRDGRVVMLMTEGREEHTFNQSVLQKKNLHASILSNQKLQSFLSKNQAPLIPRHLSPRCHEMPMQVVVVPTAQNIRSTNGEARKLKTSKCYYLSDVETNYFDEHFRYESHGTSKLELNRWLPWQSLPQRSNQVGHSSSTQNLVELLQAIQKQQYDSNTSNSSFKADEDLGCPTVQEAPASSLNTSKVASCDIFFELSWNDFDDRPFEKKDSPVQKTSNSKIESYNFFELSWGDFEDGSEDWQNDMNIKLASTTDSHLYEQSFQSIFTPPPNVHATVRIPSPPPFDNGNKEKHAHLLEELKRRAKLSRLLEKFIKKLNPSIQNAVKKMGHYFSNLASGEIDNTSFTEHNFPSSPKCSIQSSAKTPLEEKSFNEIDGTSPVISQRLLSSKRKLNLEHHPGSANKAKRMKRELFALEDDDFRGSEINSVRHEKTRHYAQDSVVDELRNSGKQNYSLSMQDKSLLSVTEIIECIESSLETCKTPVKTLENQNLKADTPQFDLECDFFDSEPLIDIKPEDCCVSPSSKTTAVKQGPNICNENARDRAPSLDFIESSPILIESSPELKFGSEVKALFVRKSLFKQENLSSPSLDSTGENSKSKLELLDYKSIWDDAFAIQFEEEDGSQIMKEEAREISWRKPEPSVKPDKKSDITREIEEIFGSEDSCVFLDEDFKPGNAPDERVLMAPESDIESPIRFRKLSHRRNNLIVSQSTPILKEALRNASNGGDRKHSTSSKHSSSSNDKPRALQFLEEEAELSLVDGSCSDDEEDSKEVDDYDGSFIDDDANTVNVNDTMRAVYLKSVKSPANRGEFVFRPPAAPMNRSDIFSQAVVEDSDYVHDSFCVESDESDALDRSCDSPEVTAFHESGGRKPRLARLKALSIKNRQARIAAAAGGLRSRKRIMYQNESSADESETSLPAKSPKKASNSAKSSISPGKNYATEPTNGSEFSVLILSGSSTVRDHDDALSTSTFESENIISFKGTDSFASKSSLVTLFRTSPSSNGSGLRLFVSSRQVPVVGQLISTLRTNCNLSVEIFSFEFADFVLSTRLGVIRKSHAEFVNGSNRSRLQEQLRHLAKYYDKPFLIVEADGVETSGSSNRRNSSFDAFSSIFKSNSPYFLQTVVALAKADITVLHSESQEGTAQLLSELSRHETLKGFNVPDGMIRNAEQEMAVKFLQCIPEINPAVAFLMVAKYKNLREIISSSTETIAQRCMISHSKAQNVLQALRVSRE